MSTRIVYKLTHDPILIILSEKDIYDYAKKLDGEICIWPSEYDGERVIIEPCYTSGQMEILPWLNKFPLKYKNGYEYKRGILRYLLSLIRMILRRVIFLKTTKII